MHNRRRLKKKGDDLLKSTIANTKSLARRMVYVEDILSTLENLEQTIDPGNLFLQSVKAVMFDELFKKMSALFVGKDNPLDITVLISNLKRPEGRAYFNINSATLDEWEIKAVRQQRTFVQMVVKFRNCEDVSLYCKKYEFQDMDISATGKLIRSVLAVIAEIYDEISQLSFEHLSPHQKIADSASLIIEKLNNQLVTHVKL